MSRFRNSGSRSLLDDEAIQQGETSARDWQLVQARLTAEAEGARADKARLLEKSKSKIKQIKETVEVLGAKLNSVQKEKTQLEHIAIQNKQKFEERLLEFERRALLAALPRINEPPAALSN